MLNSGAMQATLIGFLVPDSTRSLDPAPGHCRGAREQAPRSTGESCNDTSRAARLSCRGRSAERDAGSGGSVGCAEVTIATRKRRQQRGTNEELQAQTIQERRDETSKRSERDDLHRCLLAHGESSGGEFDPAVLLEVERARAQLFGFVEGKLREGGEVETDRELRARMRRSNRRHHELRVAQSAFSNLIDEVGISPSSRRVQYCRRPTSPS